MTNVRGHERPGERDASALGSERGEAVGIPMAGSARRRRLWTLLRLLVTLVLLAVFFYRFSPVSLFEQLGWRRLIPLAAAGVALIALALVLNATRWVLVARGIGAPLAAVQGMVLTLVGHFFSQLLPTSVGGDVVRVWGARCAGLRLRDAVSSVLFDRLCGVTTLACLIVVGMPFLAIRLDSGLPLAIAAMLAVVAALGIVALVNLHRLPTAWRHLPVCKTLAELAGSAAELLSSRPRVAAGAVALSLFAHVSALYLTAILARGFDTKLSLLDALTIVPAVMLLSNLPISIGGWGVREAGLAGGFSLLGLPIDAAVGTSILIGLLNLLAALPGGALFVARWGTHTLNPHSAAS
jgi:glycosyltransferase 2 family protein